MNIFVVVTTLCVFSETTVGQSWTYHEENNGVDTWSTNYATCATQQQSPIDIVHDDAVVDTTLGEFKHALFDAPPQSMLVKNNGHTLQVDLTNGYIINDLSLLPGKFKAEQFHFHWAAPESRGSEHLLNGGRDWGELHIVHYNTKYEDFSTAMNTSDGLAVLGFFIKDDYPQDNADIERIIEPVFNDQASYYSESATYITSFSIETFLPHNLTTYYRYQGSLTTPPCYESVVWTVFSEPIRISRRQADMFERMVFENSRGASDTTNLNDNYRPVQALNRRNVYRTAHCSGTASFLKPASHFISLCTLIIGLMRVY
ncbi:carbonic anhydrase 2-like [Clavelina lepadiformis]|uniref:carbonic anhydrase 2-like n=1 Tax=Clavelina lepadiformis TaxID=159417 RepID=UPI004042063E